MLTQIVTFLIFVAVIGCILYGRRLIRTEKVDAVFGNPERALGGTHWVVVGSSFLLLVWLIIGFTLGKLLFKSTQIGLVSMALVLIHFVLDFFSGHIHHVFGAETMELGFGLYASNPYLAVAIEALFSIVALWYYFKEEAKMGNRRLQSNKIAIISVFAYGIVFMLLIATHSFRELFDLPVFDLGFNTNIPTLIFTYGAMLYCLQYFVSKYKTA